MPGTSQQPSGRADPMRQTNDGAGVTNKGDALTERREIRARRTAAAGEGDPGTGIRPFPLGMVLRACPQIADYGPAAGIANWRELMAAAVVVRSMLGVSPSAYQDACTVMGPENAATVIACILERGGHINSAGGYLRDLTRRAEKGEFSLGPVLMAQLRANGGETKRAG